MCSTGKSGSFFYYTSDGRFLLKTMKKAEFKFFKSFLPHYFQHIVRDNKESLISRLFGLHKMILKSKGSGEQKIYFCIMDNVFNTEKVLNVRFDLKGSLAGRVTKGADSMDKINPAVALKD
jgi:1-phosphatidylinositol-4-phosphate 5-kinase